MEKYLFKNKIYDKEEYEKVVEDFFLFEDDGEIKKNELLNHPERIVFFTSLDGYDLYTDENSSWYNEHWDFKAYGVKPGTKEICIKPTVYDVILKIVKRDDIARPLFESFKFYATISGPEEAFKKILEEMKEKLEEEERKI